MWINKDGKVFTGTSVIVDGYRFFNPSAEVLRRAGYEWIEPPAPPLPEPLPKRYSKLKIIRTLGDDWPTYKAQIEAAGFLDQFMAAEFLAENDPVFAAFLANVPEDLKARLDDCRWEA